MNCKVKQCCAALAARKLAEHDPAVVEITRGGKNKSHHVLRKSDMKKVGLIAGGAFVVLTALNVYSHYKVHQAITDRKVKKQLEPMRAELEELRTQNEALRQALAEIKPRQQETATEAQPQAPGSQDLTILAAELMQNPDMGTDLGNGLHKVRMSIASKGKGKRGGARVITLIATLSKEEKEIGLHFIYDKSERENITDKELQAVLKDNGII